jgi:hypothetical protein
VGWKGSSPRLVRIPDASHLERASSYEAESGRTSQHRKAVGTSRTRAQPLKQSRSHRTEAGNTLQSWSVSSSPRARVQGHCRYSKSRVSIPRRQSKEWLAQDNYGKIENLDQLTTGFPQRQSNIALGYREKKQSIFQSVRCLDVSSGYRRVRVGRVLSGLLANFGSEWREMIGLAICYYHKPYWKGRA